jgi:hypothetical protein
MIFLRFNIIASLFCCVFCGDNFYYVFRTYSYICRKVQVMVILAFNVPAQKLYCYLLRLYTFCSIFDSQITGQVSLDLRDHI